MATTIEFLVSEALPLEGGLIVRGICNNGEIRIGQEFTEVKGGDGARANPAGLMVSKIIAYRREIDELPTGMTAEIHLIGISPEVQHGDLLVVTPHM